MLSGTGAGMQAPAFGGTICMHSSAVHDDSKMFQLHSCSGKGLHNVSEVPGT